MRTRLATDPLPTSSRRGRFGRPLGALLVLLLAGHGAAPANADTLRVDSTNSSATSPYRISGAFSGTITVAPDGWLDVVSGAQIDGGAGTGLHVTGGTVNIYGGTISGAAGVVTSGGTVNIRAGAISGPVEGVLARGGTVTISGGSVSSSNTAVWVTGGTANILGGQFSAGNVVVFLQESVDGTPTVTISGGSFTGFGVLVQNGSATIAGCNLAVSNGQLTGTLRSGQPISTSVAGPITFDPAAPLITTNPSSQTACPNSSVSFIAQATGQVTGTASVQWQVSSDGGRTFSNIPGAIDTTLIVTPVAADNGKRYRAVFTDGCNPSTTTAALLTVDTTLPTISCPENLSVPADTADGARLAFQVDASGGCGSVSTVCKVAGQDISSPYTFPVGDTTVDCTATDTAGNTAGCSFTVTVVPNANLSVNMSADANSVVKGGTLTYSITVQNSGPQPAQGVVLTDALPAGASLVSATTSAGTVTSSKGKNSTLSWNVGTLTSGQSVTLTLVVRVGAKTGTTLTNTASVSSSLLDTDLSNNSVDLQTEVLPRR